MRIFVSEVLVLPLQQVVDFLHPPTSEGLDPIHRPETKTVRVLLLHKQLSPLRTLPVPHVVVYSLDRGPTCRLKPEAVEVLQVEVRPGTENDGGQPQGYLFAVESAKTFGSCEVCSLQHQLPEVGAAS